MAIVVVTVAIVMVVFLFIAEVGKSRAVISRKIKACSSLMLWLL